MQSLVHSVKSHIVFHFANGSTYELPTKANNNARLTNYGTSIKLKEGLYSRSSSNIVGNVIGNTLSIEAVTLDKLLLPNNENSAYYGYMNDTAYVDITCDIPEDNNRSVYMGRYFVDTWEGGSSAASANEVSISCVDLLSKIKNISIGKIRLKRNIAFNDYLKTVIDKLNSTLPSYMQIQYSNSDLNIWKNSQFVWQMYFNNIDRDNIENLFNCIAKYTISYIWINRERHLKTDHLLDDTPQESVCVLNGASNLMSYGTQTGDIDKYSGIRVKYITEVTPSYEQLLQLKDIQLYKGSNPFIDQKLSSDKVWDIHTIEVNCKEGKAVSTTPSFYKNSIDFYVEATKKTKATITVYGTILNEKNKIIEKYKDNNVKETIIDIENRVLIDALIPTYAKGLISLMSMKNNQVYAEGFINPRIKLGDLVQLVGGKMGLNDYYKVTGLEYTLGTNYRCKATMIKTIEMEKSSEEILYQHNLNLLDVLSNEIVPSNKYPDITADENVICERELAEPLAQLRAVLNS